MAKLKYYFPLDNYVKSKTSTTDQSSHNEESKSIEIIEHHIKTRYTTVNIETNGLLESSFDEYKGSYIELKNDSKISIGFNDVFNKTIEDGNVLLNFFISYTEGNSVTLLKFEEENANDVLKIEKISNAYSLEFNDHNQRNTKEFGVRKNNWYNCTIHIKKDKFADVYITDQKQLISKEPIFKDVKINSSNFKIIFGPKQDGQTQDTQSLKVADLSIYEAVEQDEVIATVNTLIENQLVLLSKSSMLENVDFNLFNDEDTNRLVLQNEVQPLKIEFNLGDFQLKDDEIKTNIKGILRVKKGFFANTSIDSNGDNDEINFEISPIITDNKLIATLNELEILNVQELERVLFQLEIYNLCLVKDGNNFEENFTESDPLIIDKTFEVIDQRGENICPFDVFVLGNDTLCNDGGNTKNTINIAITNISGINLSLNSRTKFKISSNFYNILKTDTDQQVNYKILSYTDMNELKVNRDDNYLLLDKQLILSNNHSLIIQLIDIVATQSDIKTPSGSYPFYLEYINIPGYRNGKVKFFIKTGRIYYSNPKSKSK